MKKIIFSLLILFCLTFSLTSCGGGSESEGNQNEEETPLDPNYYTKELTFVLNEDGASYTAHGYGEATNLKKIVIPQTYEGLPVTIIDNFAHGPLESIKIPEGVTVIGIGAFASCKQLKHIEIPSTVEAISHQTFINSGIESITLHDGLKNIFDDAFKNCTNLKSIVIPQTVEYMQGSIFQGCSSLETVVLPNYISKLDDNFFDGCTSLKNVTVNTTYLSLGKYAFANCSSLEKFTFATTSSSIPAFVFSGCTSLKEVVIPASVKKIGYDAFANCNSLETVYFEGTQEQWNKITVDTTNGSNQALLNANVIFEYVRPSA